MNNPQSTNRGLGRYWFALALVAALLTTAVITAAVNAATGGPSLSQQIGYYLYLPLVYN